MCVTKNFTEDTGDKLIALIDEIIKENTQDKKSIIVGAPTGKGKSHFIKHSLYDYCKDRNYRILLLLPRRVVKDEFNAEISKDAKNDIITIKSYQSFELAEGSPTFETYDIVVCDECHYFISDSDFNKTIERSYHRILQDAKQKVVVYLTATPYPFAYRLALDLEKEKRVLIGRELDGLSPIKRVKFFSADSDTLKKTNVKHILDSISQNDEKAIVFCDTAKYAHELYEQYSTQSLFICSVHNTKNKNYIGDIDEEAYNKLITEHKFEYKFLFCTSALDVGFSIKDRSVKHVICLLHDQNSIIQAIGRKRFVDNDPTDTITVYLRDYSNQGIGGLLTAYHRYFEHYEYFIENGEDAYFDKYYRQPDPYGIVCIGRRKGGGLSFEINELRLCKYQYQYLTLQQINSIDSDYRYRDYMLQELKQPPRQKVNISKISEVLEPLASNRVIFEKKSSSYDQIVSTIAYDNGHGILFKGEKKLNEYLERHNIPYRIVKDNNSKRKVLYYVQKNIQS